MSKVGSQGSIIPTSEWTNVGWKVGREDVNFVGAPQHCRPSFETTSKLDPSPDGPSFPELGWLGMSCCRKLVHWFRPYLAVRAWTNVEGLGRI